MQIDGGNVADGAACCRLQQHPGTYGGRHNERYNSMLYHQQSPDMMEGNRFRRNVEDCFIFLGKGCLLQDPSKQVRIDQTRPRPYCRIHVMMQATDIKGLLL